MHKYNEEVTLFWFRRDLRLEDNHALFLALQHKKVLPIFIFDTSILSKLDNDDARVSFIYQQLKKIDKTLKTYGSSLKIYIGEPLKIWQTIITTHNVKNVFANEDYEPYAIKRDNEVEKLLKGNLIKFNLVKDQVIFDKNEVVKKDGLPYTVYTPYKKAWLVKFEKKLINPFESISKLGNLLKYQSNFPLLSEIGFSMSSVKVKQINSLNLDRYDELRDFPSIDATSYISVHLRFGTISIRESVKISLEKNAVWLSELIWREFFMQILYHFPKVVNQSFKSKYDRIKWNNNVGLFDAWCNGKTGYLLVDAGMRQLNETGYMHNRVRMICASFLCKHLLIDWRLGEAYFTKKLLDFDLASNNGNWQWIAGSGCDASPYFRIFNPLIQLKKFDKELIYCKKWIKDLNELTYPNPIVEHTIAREKCLNLYKKYLF